MIAVPDQKLISISFVFTLSSHYHAISKS